MAGSIAVGIISSPAANLSVGTSVPLNCRGDGFNGGHWQEKATVKTTASGSLSIRGHICRPKLSKNVQTLARTVSSSSNSRILNGRSIVSNKLRASPEHAEKFDQESTSSSAPLVEPVKSSEPFPLRKKDRSSLPKDDDRKHPTVDGATASVSTDAHSEPQSYEDLLVGPRWREIQGEQNWKGLLDPMDRVLAGELIRYGELAQATYDAFDSDQNSDFCGSCKVGKGQFFKRLSLENRGYEITQYIYCTSDIHLPNFFKKPKLTPDDEKWSKDSNWMGFVAVCTSPDEIVRLGRRDIVVAWRGTVTGLEWIADLQTCLYPTGMAPSGAGKGSSSPESLNVKVELGFLSLYTSKKEKSRYNKASAREQVLRTLKKLMARYEGEELSITVTGHSMGGALATLCAYDIAESGQNLYRQGTDPREAHVHNPAKFSVAGTTTGLPVIDSVTCKICDPRAESSEQAAQNAAGAGYGGENNRVPITVYTFAGPRVGNNAFRDRVDELGVKVLRVVNVHDLVPNVPGWIFNQTLKVFSLKFWPQLRKSLLVNGIHNLLELLPATYSHVGMLLQLDSLQSPFLKRKTDPLSAHNLEAYLHLLDGFQGKSSGGFDADFYGKRDLALVNKYIDLLNNEHKIPSCWWQEKNKGLVKTEGGRYVMHGRKPEELPEIEQPLHHDGRNLELFLEEPRRH